MRRFGAHLSISGGLIKAAESLVKINGNCLQIFSGSPRGWQEQLPSEAEIKKFRDFCTAKDIQPIFIHAKYLINLGSDKKELYELSQQSLKHDLQVAGLIGAVGVIVHLGSHQGRGFAAPRAQ